MSGANKITVVAITSMGNGVKHVTARAGSEADTEPIDPLPDPLPDFISDAVAAVCHCGPGCHPVGVCAQDDRTLAVVCAA